MKGGRTRRGVTLLAVVSLLLLLPYITFGLETCDQQAAWNTNPPVLSGVASVFNITAQAGGGFSTGACGWIVDPNDLNVGAYTASTNQAECTLCGNCYNVTGPYGSVVVRVADYCDTSQQGGCGLNVSPQWVLDKQPWATITQNKFPGRCNITWYGPVACPLTGSLNYEGFSGANPYYVAITIRNFKYPLLNVEFENKGIWYNVSRQPGNQWWYNPPVGINQTWPFQIRVTDVLGNTVEDTITNYTMFGSQGKYVTQGNPSASASVTATRTPVISNSPSSSSAAASGSGSGSAATSASASISSSSAPSTSSAASNSLRLSLPALSSSIASASNSPVGGNPQQSVSGSAAAASSHASASAAGSGSSAPSTSSGISLSQRASFTSSSAALASGSSLTSASSTNSRQAGATASSVVNRSLSTSSISSAAPGTSSMSSESESAATASGIASYTTEPSGSINSESESESTAPGSVGTTTTATASAVTTVSWLSLLLNKFSFFQLFLK